MGLLSYFYKNSSVFIRQQDQIAALRVKYEKYQKLKTKYADQQTKYLELKALHEKWGATGPAHAYGQVKLDSRLLAEPALPDGIPTPPAWATGYIGAADVAFLFNLITMTKPRRMIEVGVASGYSTAVILKAMATYMESGLDSESAWLHSYDISPVCYFDDSRRTGCAVDELTPDLIPHLDLQLGVMALEARQLPDDNMADMAFIDAHHDHPWAVFDILSILPRLRPGSCVILHDVFLPFLHEPFQNCGPNLLFSLWPGEKLLQPEGNHYRNMGAIRLLDSHEATRKALAPMLDMPWESEGPDKALLEKAFKD